MWSVLFRFPEEVKQYVKQKCISIIGDPSPLIRATVGIVISMIANKGELTNWPELLPALCQLIESPDQNVCEVSKYCILKGVICIIIYFWLITLYICYCKSLRCIYVWLTVNNLPYSDCVTNFRLNNEFYAILIKQYSQWLWIEVKVHSIRKRYKCYRIAVSGQIECFTYYEHVS